MQINFHISMCKFNKFKQFVFFAFTFLYLGIEVRSQNLCEGRVPLIKEIVGDTINKKFETEFYVYIPSDVCGSLCGEPLERELVKYWGRVADRTYLLISGNKTLKTIEAEETFKHKFNFNRFVLFNPPLYSPYCFVFKNNTLIYCDEFEKKSLKKWKKFLKSY